MEKKRGRGREGTTLREQKKKGKREGRERSSLNLGVLLDSSGSAQFRARVPPTEVLTRDTARETRRMSLWIEDEESSSVSAIVDLLRKEA